MSEDKKPDPAGDYLRQLRTGAQILDEPGPEPDWGPWKLKMSNLTLQLEHDGEWIYEIDLEDCLDSARTLDWICQIAGKFWADDATIAGLVRALDDPIHPQKRLCSGGIHKTITKDDVLAAVLNWTADTDKISKVMYRDA